MNKIIVIFQNVFFAYRINIIHSEPMRNYVISTVTFVNYELAYIHYTLNPVSMIYLHVIHFISHYNCSSTVFKSQQRRIEARIYHADQTDWQGCVSSYRAKCTAVLLSCSSLTRSL